ncbi:MAG: nidogen-like domain-containing protein, partial [Nocardioides sp.]
MNTTHSLGRIPTWLLALLVALSGLSLATQAEAANDQAGKDGEYSKDGRDRPNPAAVNDPTELVGTALATVAGQDLEWCRTNALPRNDDSSSAAITTPFPLTFFGTAYTTLYVNNNGNITFNEPRSQYTPDDLTGATNRPIIAPFFADVDTRSEGSAEVTYGASPDGKAFCVNWMDVGYFNSRSDKLNSFQLILRSAQDEPGRGAGDFDMVFNYDKILWETGSASGGTDGLGAILDDKELVLPRDGHDLIHSRGLAEDVDDHDALGLRRDRLGDRFGADAPGVGIDVDEHRRGADVADAPAAGGEGERRRDDLVARPEAAADGREVQRRRAAVHAQRARMAERGAEGLLKVLHVLAEAEAGVVVGGGERREHLGADRLVLRLEIEEGDFHEEFSADYADERGLLKTTPAGVILSAAKNPSAFPPPVGSFVALRMTDRGNPSVPSVSSAAKFLQEFVHQRIQAGVGGLEVHRDAELLHRGGRA